MKYLGYIECDGCKSYVYLSNESDVKIWVHPDDELGYISATCERCGTTTEDRVAHDHISNFARRGIYARDFNDKFSDDPLTEEMIDEWVENFSKDGIGELFC